MATLRQTTVGMIVFLLAGVLFQSSCAAGAEQSQPTQKPADKLLLGIMDLHAQLVTNDVFLAQAKMLGAYLESAQPMEETEKTDIYRRVLDILLEIKEAGAKAPASPPQERAKPEQKPIEQTQEDESVYVPGAALLEIFNADSIAKDQDVPSIRTYWQRDLSYRGDFLLPGREAEVGFDHMRGRTRYGAKFAFYYQAARPGKYGFTVIHSLYNRCVLKVGGVEVVKTQSEGAGQGVCSLEKGFHRVEFWIYVGTPMTVRMGSARLSDFQVKVVTPDGFDSVALTKDMMLLRADEKKRADLDRGGRGEGQRVPYLDY